MNSSDKALTIYFSVLSVCVTVILLAGILGCTSTPSCLDNLRNMQCMTAEQLQKELSP